MAAGNLGTKGEGAGVVLAIALPGGAVYGNTVERNAISGNGLSGVTVNNLGGDKDFAPHVDDQTTGVLAATVSPLTIDVARNTITGDHFGIWTTGPATVRHATGNVFPGVAVPVARG